MAKRKAPPRLYIFDRNPWKAALKFPFTYKMQLEYVRSRKEGGKIFTYVACLSLMINLLLVLLLLLLYINSTDFASELVWGFVKFIFAVFFVAYVIFVIIEPDLPIYVKILDNSVLQMYKKGELLDDNPADDYARFKKDYLAKHQPPTWMSF